MMKSNAVMAYLRGAGFVFIKDPQSKYNLIAPQVLKLLKGQVKTTPAKERMSQQEYDALMKSAPFNAPLCYDKDLYTVVGHKVVWRKWRPKLLKRIMLNFEIEGKSFCEEFLVDRRVCALNKQAGGSVVGLLEGNF